MNHAWLGPIVLLFTTCREPDPPKAVPVVESAPSAPVCIQETCTERPRWLVCEKDTVYKCWQYRIDYERHCVCDKWGPNEGR